MMNDTVLGSAVDQIAALMRPQLASLCTCPRWAESILWSATCSRWENDIVTDVSKRGCYY